MADLRRRPTFRHVFVLHDGETIMVPQHDAERVIAKRSDRADPETCWDVTLPSGIVRRLWPSDIRSWDVEDMVTSGKGSVST